MIIEPWAALTTPRARQSEISFRALPKNARHARRQFEFSHSLINTLLVSSALRLGGK